MFAAAMQSAKKVRGAGFIGRLDRARRFDQPAAAAVASLRVNTSTVALAR
jgi:hypothetical protein